MCRFVISWLTWLTFSKRDYTMTMKSEDGEEKLIKKGNTPPTGDTINHKDRNARCVETNELLDDPTNKRQQQLEQRKQHQRKQEQEKKITFYKKLKKKILRRREDKKSALPALLCSFFVLLSFTPHFPFCFEKKKNESSNWPNLPQLQWLPAEVITLNTLSLLLRQPMFSSFSLLQVCQERLTDRRDFPSPS